MELKPSASNTDIPTAMLGRTVHPWDKGAVVAELQELLIAHGFNQIRVDGDFGYRTEAAVRAVQRQHGLRIDGCVGPKTWAALKANVQPGARLLKPGHTGADVAELQGLLRVNGYTVDRNGIFCLKTQECITAFQHRHKLREDGVVDALTWAVLRGKPLTGVRRRQKRWFWDNRKWW